MTGIGQSLVRLVATGTLAVGQTWSTGLWIDLGDPAPQPSQADLDAYAVSCAALLKPQFQIIANNLWSNTTNLQTLTAYWYAPNTTKAAMVSTAAPMAVVGVGTGALPLFTSVCFSLRSATPGRSGRGRNYMPCTIGGVIGGTGQVGGTSVTNSSPAWAAAIRGLNGMAAGVVNPHGQTVVVASFTKGAGYPIRSIVIDSIPDTQHRREDKLVAVTVSTTAV